jgi:hypothetical protein
MSSANNTIVELLSPQDILSGYQYTYKGSQSGEIVNALMNNWNKEAEEEREEVTDDENSNMEVDECPICMDAIDSARNCVTTECGHKFHAKCLFENISRNGFDCPCCRGKMAEEEEDEEDDEQDDDDDDDDEYYADDVEEEEDNTDHLLRGMRWMFQRASNDGGVVDEDEEEDDEDTVIEEEGEEEVEEVEPPNVELIMEKLAERGITFEQAIKGLLNDCHPEYSTRFVTEADQLFGAVRSILANHARGENRM